MGVEATRSSDKKKNREAPDGPSICEQEEEKRGRRSGGSCGGIRRGGCGGTLRQEEKEGWGRCQRPRRGRDDAAGGVRGHLEIQGVAGGLCLPDRPGPQKE